MEIKLINLIYKKIFKNLNISFKEKEITSIVGKSSIEKTTLLNLLSKKIQNYDGEIHIKNNIYFYESNLPYIPLCAIDKIKYLNFKITTDGIYNLAQQFNISPELLKKNYITISSGEIKKMELLIAIISQAEVVLLDNPTDGLDDKSVETLIKLLKKSKKSGKTIIISSNDSDFIYKVSDRIVVLSNKEIVLNIDKNTFFKDSEGLKIAGLGLPNILKFINKVYEIKKVKLLNRDNINDLIKDVYRSDR